jgi:hypothetical protein
MFEVQFVECLSILLSDHHNVFSSLPLRFYLLGLLLWLDMHSLLPKAVFQVTQVGIYECIQIYDLVHEMHLTSKQKG